MRLSWNLVLAMAVLTILCTMFSSTTKCVHQNWKGYFSSAHSNNMKAEKAKKEWRHVNSPKHKKNSWKPSSGKVMLTLLWDTKGPILEHYISKGTMITSSSYCDLLVNHLKPAIWSKCRGLPISPLHDNSQPHTAHVMVAKMKDLHFACLPNPPHSPDLVPSDFQEAVQEFFFQEGFRL